MGLHPELARLVQKLKPGEPADQAVLAAAGKELEIEWPADYRALMIELGAAEGFVGENYVRFTPCTQLVEINHLAQRPPKLDLPVPARPAWMAKYKWGNDEPEEEFFPGLVLIGSNGGGENLAFDRKTGAVVLVPAIGNIEDAILLGANLTEALQSFERDDMFDDPVHPFAK